MALAQTLIKTWDDIWMSESSISPHLIAYKSKGLLCRGAARWPRFEQLHWAATTEYYVPMVCAHKCYPVFYWHGPRHVTQEQDTGIG